MCPLLLKISKISKNNNTNFGKELYNFRYNECSKAYQTSEGRSKHQSAKILRPEDLETWRPESDSYINPNMSEFRIEVFVL
jgi:hypothetical protein